MHLLAAVGQAWPGTRRRNRAALRQRVSAEPCTPDFWRRLRRQRRPEDFRSALHPGSSFRAEDSFLWTLRRLRCRRANPTGSWGCQRAGRPRSPGEVRPLLLLAIRVSRRGRGACRVASTGRSAAFRASPAPFSRCDLFPKHRPCPPQGPS